MAVRRIQWKGFTALAIIYFGALLYWKWEPLTGTDSAESWKAAIMLLTSLPYIAFVMWGLNRDLPESVTDHPVGRFTKPFIWALIILGLVVWAYFEPGNVGFLLVGIGLLGLGAAAAFTCLLYTGEESSRLYALRRMVDVYPSITKPDGHVRFG